jgi:hypothetical protein
MCKDWGKELLLVAEDPLAPAPNPNPNPAPSKEKEAKPVEPSLNLASQES